MVERHWRRRWVFIAIGVFAVAILGWVIFHKRPAKPAPPPRVAVSVATVARQNVPVYLTALGAAQAWKSDIIYAQVSGILLSVAAEGTNVKVGQVLAQVDPSTYRAALTQAQGALQRDQALLADARLDLTRYQTLEAQNSIARQQVDTQAALVKQDEGVVLLDQGALAAAQINLDRCRITSPIAGRTGVRITDPGNLINAGAASTTTAPVTAVTGSATSAGGGIIIVNQIEPIAVTFSIPQGQYQRLADLSDRFRKPLATEALNQDTGASEGWGQLSIADNRVDAATGTVEMKARFANTDDRLLPGQFVNVRLTLQTLSNVATVPSTAVNRGPNGPFVYVVGSDQKAAMRTVKVALTQGTTAVIASGLSPGETVVTDGQTALSPGSLVRIATSGPSAAGASPP
jgi:multidrug efflux system membrane fusion protein